MNLDPLELLLWIGNPCFLSAVGVFGGQGTPMSEQIE